MSKQYSEMRKQANADVRFERGESQKEITDVYRQNFDKIFRTGYNATHKELTNGTNEQKQ